MAELIPKIILRMGSHSEKEYIEKTAKFLDGLIIGANLMEASPVASASFVLKLSGAKGTMPYYLDPMTYAFGCYIDPKTKAYRQDMDWIKSEQKLKNGKIVKAFKRSYVALADKVGGIFSNALSRHVAISPSDFSSAKIYNDTCKSVAEYQLDRIAAEFRDDPEHANFASDIPKPNVVFTPYFYIDPTKAKEWVKTMLQLSTATVQLGLNHPVHTVVCVDEDFLNNQEFFDYLAAELPKTKVQGVWLWMSKLYEDGANETKLRTYRKFVEGLSKQMEVYSLHGGYFSLIMSKFGMSGVSHGVGYGEQKNVVPVVGKATPTVRYYLRPIHRRLSVPQIQRCFNALRITDVSQFHAQICNCVVCKGVVANKLTDFDAFGAMHHSKIDSKRPTQTPAAAKRCRYHFLLNRIKERDWIKNTKLSDILADLRNARGIWCKQPTISPECNHLVPWEKVLV